MAQSNSQSEQDGVIDDIELSLKNLKNKAQTIASETEYQAPLISGIDTNMDETQQQFHWNLAHIGQLMKKSNCCFPYGIVVFLIIMIFILIILLIWG